MHVCPVCMGHPGTLPVANAVAIQKVLSVGLALGCAVAPYSKFDRKSYFYPDLPKGYQISQYDMPLTSKGILEIQTPEHGAKKIRITRIHLEEDTGKLIHLFKTEGSSGPERPEGANYSLVDFNRAGVPLMELVTEPDITSGPEARVFAQELQLILRYLDASDADMEKGQMRIEANVSVRPEGTETLGTKVEVKNLNSFRSVERAIAYEIARQSTLLQAGGKVIQETRGWNDSKGETFSQREKEEAFEYRYFPEPDLLPMEFSGTDIEQIRARLPELPQQRRERLFREYELTTKEVEVLVSNKHVGEFFEDTVSELGPRLQESQLKKLIRLSVNYLCSDLLGLLAGTPIKEEGKFKVSPENFAELMVLIHEQKISSPAAKATLREMVATGADPDHIIEEKGYAQLFDESTIEEAARRVITEHPQAVEDFKKGKGASLQFLVGKLMGATKGAANPELAREILLKLLSEE